MTSDPARTVTVDLLARVEGEGAIDIRVAHDGSVEADLRIFEPPRLFEAFLRGRRFVEAPDLTARICGICPVAYQISAVKAMESLCGVEVSENVRRLRRLLYCGEWIESHALHVHLLHAPDFLGFDGPLEMARRHGEHVARGLSIKKAGNAVVAALGGREIHPVGVRVGGFWKLPRRADLDALREPLRRALDDAIASVRWVAGFEFPELETSATFLALRPERGYPIEEGIPFVEGQGPFPVEEFDAHVIEEQSPHSTAFHAALWPRGDTLLTGPLARWALCGDRATPAARRAAAEAGLEAPCRNPFRAIVVRAVETVVAVEEALRLLEEIDPAAPASVPVEPREGTGAGASEAPRGLLFHRYRLAADGTIREARIVPPTAQNQRAIEADLREVASRNVARPDATLALACERAVRNHDPCISCATHALRARVRREVP